MKLQITKSELGGAYLLDGKRILPQQIGNLIREGNEVSILDPQGIDFTQETLVKIAFQDVFPPNIKDEYVNVMATFLDRADLLLVIENGGYDAFLHRRSRAALFEGEYFFDKVDQLVDRYWESGNDLEELNIYFNNLIKGIR